MRTMAGRTGDQGVPGQERAGSCCGLHRAPAWMKGRAARAVWRIGFLGAVAWTVRNVWITLAANPLPFLTVVLGLAGAVVCGVVLLVCRDAYMARVPPEMRRRHAVWADLALSCGTILIAAVLLLWPAVFLYCPGLLTIMWTAHRSAFLGIVVWAAICLALGVAGLVRFFRKRRAAT